MTTQQLIAKLQQMPKDKTVYIYDYLENELDDDGDGSTAGLYEDFEVSTIENKEEGMQAVVLSFKNNTVG